MRRGFINPGLQYYAYSLVSQTSSVKKDTYVYTIESGVAMLIFIASDIDSHKIGAQILLNSKSLGNSFQRTSAGAERRACKAAGKVGFSNISRCLQRLFPVRHRLFLPLSETLQVQCDHKK